MMENIHIYNDDMLTTKVIPESSVDLIVTSPPYNLDMSYKSFDDNMNYSSYLEVFEEWMKRCYYFSKDDGRMCLNVPLDKSKGGYESVGADITGIVKKVGWRYKTTIIWNEGNISKGSAWGSWMNASAPHVIAPVELIIVFYKKIWKKSSGTRISDITKEEFVQWTNGLWSFKGESKRKIGHPCPYPIELPYRCIKLFSFVGDVIMDPFMGSGSTIIAAKNTNRVGIGIDIEKEYCELAKSRLQSKQKGIK